jgi:hypothetical protein
MNGEIDTVGGASTNGERWPPKELRFMYMHWFKASHAFASPTLLMQRNNQENFTQRRKISYRQL